MDDPELYWRILLTPDDGLVVACMQWFDEMHYDHSQYFDHVQYRTEAEAQAVVDRLVQGALQTMINRNTKITIEDLPDGSRRTTYEPVY